MEPTVEDYQIKIAELQAMVNVPGQWVCDKCGFQLTKSFLYVKTGGIGPNCSKAEKCPNDGETMRAQTWKEAAEGADRYARVLIKRFAVIRELAGDFRSGESLTVKVSQDDATGEWFVSAGQFSAQGPSIDQAFDAAVEKLKL